MKTANTRKRLPACTGASADAGQPAAGISLSRLLRPLRIPHGVGLRGLSRQVPTVANDFWGPIGRFAWRPLDRSKDIVEIVAAEIAKFGVSWAPLKAGLFDGSLTRLNAVKAGFDSVLGKARVRYH